MRHMSKYPMILLMIYITSLLMTVAMANRLIQLGPVAEAGGIFVFPLMFPILDVMGEVYGYAYARFFIWLGVIAEFIFAGYTTIASSLPYPDFFQHAVAYNTVFDPTLRYVLSGLAGTLCGEFINIYLLAKWKIKMRGRHFLLRSVLSTAVGQALLSIVVIGLMFAGKLNFAQLINIMIGGWALKMLFEAIYVIPSWFIVAFLKKKEGIEYYDATTNFSPFKVAIE